MEWNVSSAKLHIWCCCFQVTSIGKCLYTTVYSVPLSFSLRVFDSFSFIHLRKYGILIVSLCKALFFFPYQFLCFYLVCFILYLDLWVLFYVFHCWLSFLRCPMPSNAAVVWEEVLKVIINMGGVCRFEEEKLTYGSPADVFWGIFICFLFWSLYWLAYRRKRNWERNEKCQLLEMTVTFSIMLLA